MTTAVAGMQVSESSEEDLGTTVGAMSGHTDNLITVVQQLMECLDKLERCAGQETRRETVRRDSRDHSPREQWAADITC